MKHPNKLKRKYRDWRIRRQSRRAAILLIRLDLGMERMGWSSQKRQQFWRDFIKSPRNRAQVFKSLILKQDGKKK